VVLVRRVRRHFRYIRIFLLFQVSKELRLLWEEFDVERGLVTMVGSVERFLYMKGSVVILISIHNTTPS